MALRGTRRPKIGNWYEDLLQEEDVWKKYLEKKERGDLAEQKTQLLKDNILRPVPLSVPTDGAVHFGDTVMLVNVGRGGSPCTAVSLDAGLSQLTQKPTPGLLPPCEVSAGQVLHPCSRNAFVITSVDGRVDGSSLHYDQSFALRTTSGFAGGLFLTSDLKTFHKCAKKSGLQEVSLETQGSFLSWWKVVHFDPQERLEHEGLPVPANAKVLIVHCKTNQALAVLGDHVLWTMYGREFELTAHTFLDSHKAEEERNHWWICTSDPGQEGLVLFDHPGAQEMPQQPDLGFSRETVGSEHGTWQ